MISMKYITLMRGKLFTSSYDTILKRGDLFFKVWSDVIFLHFPHIYTKFSKQVIMHK